MALFAKKGDRFMKLGVIGGLGPLATAYYYELLTKMSDVRFDQDHLEILIHSCPRIPDRTGYILNHHKKSPVSDLIRVGQGLEKQGVDYIAIPCITAHYFHHELSSAIHVPIIHLVEEVSQYLQRNHIHRVGILATDGTIQTRLFQNELEKNCIECIIPHKISQRDVMHLIYQNIKLGHDIEIDLFEKVSAELFDQGAEVIILGCTELSIIKKQYSLDDRYLDAMELLSAVALQKCLIPIKKEYKYLID